jgi:hypothetical protein
MNDFSELENRLKNLRPVPPSEDLVARIERALAEAASPATAGVTWRRFPTCDPTKAAPKVAPESVNWLSFGLGLAAAAALLLFVLVKPEQPARRNPTIASLTPAPAASSINARFVPAGLTRVVYTTRAEGLFFPAGSDEPMRRVRSQKRETLQWRNPTTGASLSVSYPSEETFLIPVSGQ